MSERSDLITCGRLLAERELVWGHSGNLSLKINSERFLISAGGTDLGRLQEEDIIVCRIDSNESEGPRRPSMETGLHRGIYGCCDAAKAVIHSQPFYSTLVACSGIDIRTDCLPEAMAYVGRVVRVPYHHAGSHELAEAVSAIAPSSQVLLLNNHGVVCWGASLEECLLLTETLEFLSRLLIVARTGGIELNFLGETVMADFARHLKSIGR